MTQMKPRLKIDPVGASDSKVIRVLNGLTCVYAMLLALSVAGQAADGPGFGSKLLQQTDVRFSSTLSPDNNALSVLFDNLRIELLEHDAAPPVVARTFTLSIPIKDGGVGASVGMDIRGTIHRTAGASGLLVLWVNGRSTVIELSQMTDGDFVHHIDVIFEKNTQCQLIFILMVERDPKPGKSGAMLAVDSIDASIKPSALPKP